LSIRPLAKIRVAAVRQEIGNSSHKFFACDKNYFQGKLVLSRLEDCMTGQNQGVRRLYLIARVFALGGAALGVLFWFVIWWKARPAQPGQQFGLANLPDYVVPPLLLGGLIALVAWIIDGFFQREPQEQEAK
jgi:hypothetical protein